MKNFLLLVALHSLLPFAAAQNVGIGTEAPIHPLHVVAPNPNMTVGRFSTTSGESKVVVDNNLISTTLSANPFRAYVGTQTPHDFSISTGGLTQMIFSQANGYVGVGLQVPEYKFHVNGFDPIVSKFSTEASVGEIIVNTASQEVDLGAYDGGGYTGTLGEGDFHIRTGGASRIYLEHATNEIGFGTSNPTHDFQMYTSGETELAIESGQANSHLWTLQSNGAPSPTSSTTTFQIFDRTNGLPRLGINNNGFVGIGTQTPGRLVHIKSAQVSELMLESGMTGNHLWGIQARGTMVNQPNFPTFQIWDNTANLSRFGINNSGYVGIGTMNASHKLHVSTNENYISKFTSTDNQFGEIIVEGASNAVDLGAYSGGGYTGTLGTGDFHIRTGGGSRIFLEHASNEIGFGTSNPTRDYHMYSNGETELALESAQDNNHLWTLQSNGVPSPTSFFPTFQIIDRTTNVSQLGINNYGYVGIGTQDALYKLHVHANDPIISKFSTESGVGEIVVNSAGSSVDLGAYSGGGYTGTLGTGDFHIRAGGTSRIFIEHASNEVGIGTVSPQTNLDVNGGIRTKYSGSTVVLLNPGTATYTYTMNEPVPSDWNFTNTVFLVSNSEGTKGVIQQARMISSTTYEITYEALEFGWVRFNYIIFKM